MDESTEKQGTENLSSTEKDSTENQDTKKTGVELNENERPIHEVVKEIGNEVPDKEWSNLAEEVTTLKEELNRVTNELTERERLYQGLKERYDSMTATYDKQLVKATDTIDRLQAYIKRLEGQSTEN